MGFSVHWSWLAVLSCLLYMGDEVRCDCTEENIQIEGGQYTLTKQLVSGSLLIYSCPEGYYPHPTLTRVCQLNGTWRPPPKRFLPQKCRIVECPDPNVLEYGNVSPPQEKYFVNNETTYECYSGYTMRGSSSRVCLPNGKWSGATPICSRDSENNCPDPGIPAGASRTGNTFGIDDTVKYTCNGNLFLVGSSERVCQENGQWTGKEPACYYRHTFDTPLEVSQAFGSAIKDSLTTLEPIDDTQEGRTIRISKNETLNIYIAVDISESIEEDQVNSAKKAVITLIDKISSFSVTPNYGVIFFSSEVFEVVKILDFLNGKVVLNTIKDEINKFKVSDRNAGTDLNLVFRTFLERMAVIKQLAGDKQFKEHRHVIIVFTDGAYNMGGSPAPTVEKIKNMVYMNHTVEGETQSREEYLDIYVFAIGAEIFDDDLQPLTVGVGGKHYFRMKDIQNLQQTFDDIIDEEQVMGLCGLHRDYDGHTAKSNERAMHPWVAFINVQTEGKSQKKCIGSLVTPQFVLTAAHCFTFGNLPEHVTVDIDDGRGKVKKVRNFIVHPKYNINGKANEGVKEFYDYDVALIQLTEYVEISINVRPICIPCTKQTNEALKLSVDSTCKDQEQLLLKSHLERLSFLTRTDKWVKEKDAHAKLGDNRDGCIKHALEAPGITTKNPKDAVTDIFLCTGGQSPQRDHVACPGDSGGAVYRNYEQRTIQVALVSWGTKDLCKTRGNMAESDDTSRDFHINLFRVVRFLKSVLGNDTLEYEPLPFLES
ncbi:complement factor B-like [Micropterus dolomieu]|uniref:complement factor B-like n=1 Tax=Micropterus dolomieu TaxID=147949 RepID=UPI001E8E06D7|nr:complement factor B-like [Micropterus dolomieu]